jgi:hypothetical protein
LAAADRVISPLRPPDPTLERKLEVGQWIRHPQLPHAHQIQKIADGYIYLTYPGQSKDASIKFRVEETSRCERLSNIEARQYEILLRIDDRANQFAREIAHDIIDFRVDYLSTIVRYGFDHRQKVRQAQQLAESLHNKTKRQVAPATKAAPAEKPTELAPAFKSNGSIKVVKKGGVFELRGHTKPLAEKLASAGATWQPKLLCWTYQGDKLPEGITALLNDLKTVH